MAIEEKPSRNEDEYFVKENAELIKAQRARLDAERERAEREAQRLAHFMKCPKCGSDLREESLGPIKIDRCTSCHGVWLDAGETEMLTRVDQESHSGFLGGLFHRRK